MKRFLSALSLFLVLTSCSPRNSNTEVFQIPDYEEDWEFYFSRVDYKLASLFVDLGLKDIAPVKGFGNVGYVTVKMNLPREDGLSSQEESETLYQIGDSLVDHVTRGNNSIYVGRNTSDNHREFYFFIADTIIWYRLVSESMAGFPAYQYDHGYKPDKRWGGYFDYLYPGPQNWQSIQNRRVVEQLEKGGDLLTKERQVDHWIYFETEKDRDSYVVKVKPDSFKIENTTKIDDAEKFPYSLQISRIDRVDYSSIDELVIPLWKLALELNGEYDGWETSIEQEDEELSVSNIDSSHCNINTLGIIHNNLNELSKAQIDALLRTFHSSCSINVEFSEWSNELLYQVLASNTEVVLELLTANYNEYQYEALLSEIGDPINDAIMPQPLIDKIKNLGEPGEQTKQILTALQIAADKY